jgi:chromosome segregation ATPase
MSKRHWLNLVEYVFIAGSVAGTVAAVTTKQLIFAVTPLTIAIGLNAINRQRFNQLSQQQVEQLQKLIQQTQESQNLTYVSFNQLINSIAQRQDELQELTAQIHPQTQQQIEQLQAALTHSTQSINSLNQRQDELQELTAQIHPQTQQQIEQLQAALTHSTQSINSLNQRQDELQELTAQIHPQTQQQIEQLQAALTHSTQSINSLAQQVSQLENFSQQIDSQTEQLRLLEMRRIHLESELEQLDIIKQQIQNYNHKIQLTDDRLSQLEKDLKTTSSQIQELIRQTQETQNQTTEKIEELIRRNVSFKQLINYLTKRQDKLQELTAQIPQTQQQIEEFKVALTHFTQSINSLAQRQDELQELTVQIHPQTQQQIEEFKAALTYSNQSINSLSQRQDELQELTNQIPQTQQQIEEFKATLTHSTQSINFLAERLSQLENLSNSSPLTSDVEALRSQIKQVNKILEYLNNTKAEKEEVIEIDRRTRQVKESQQKVAQISNSIVNDILSSKDNDRLIDSSDKLASFLKARNWKEANEETARILLRLAEKQSHESLSCEDIKKLPTEELNALDRLWSTYSNGRFSWSVQKQIWEELGGQARVYNMQIYEQWSKKVGWRVVNEWLSYLELDFTDEAPIGHFPAIYIKWSSWGSAWCGTETIMLFSKIDRTQFHQHREDNPTQNIRRERQEFGTNIGQEMNAIGDKLKKAFNPLNNLF